MPKRVVELIWSAGRGDFGNHHSIDVWGAMPHWVMLIIWKERSLRTFEWIECLSV